MSNVVTQLPPTIGIKDPEVRAYLDALTNAWSLRSGDINSDAPERYVTAGEFEEMAGKAIIGALGSAVPGWTTGTTGGSVAQAVSSLSEEIKRSILYQILGTQFGQIDLAAMQARVDAAFQSANTLFAEERLQRENAVESVTEQINIQASRMGQAESAITSETSTRATKDDAIAAAVNRIWAEIGGTQAAIQDGQLAAVSPSAVQATKWQQVQVALTDPATGQVMQTAIKQELNSYANKADGTLNSIYSVRAQLTQDGRTIVGGFGLAATGGAGSPQGPTIDFGVRADRFFIARTAQTPDLAAQLDGANDDVPFIVVTTPQTINGQLYPPGVYLKSAFIVDASIDSAKIRDLAVTRAKIGNAAIGSAQIDNLAVGSAHIQNLSVDTIKIADRAVTSSVSASGTGDISTTMTIPAGVTADVAIFFGTKNFRTSQWDPEAFAVEVDALVDGSLVASNIPPYSWTTGGGSGGGGYTIGIYYGTTYLKQVRLGSGVHTFRARCDSVPRPDLVQLELAVIGSWK